MTKIEIELTDEQIEKLESLSKDDFDFGKAIDEFFETREIVSKKIEELENNPSLAAHLLDVENKSENLEDNYGEGEETYEVKINQIKHNVSWAKDFFRL